MEPIKNWDVIEVPSDFEKIELGGHICVIKQVKVTTTRNGGELLIIAFDFAQNDSQAFYFNKKHEEDKKRNPSAKWRGVYYQMFGSENSNPYFKKLIKNIEKSNVGYQWDWNENSLIGKQFGGIFGREEYLNDKGEKKFYTKCRFIVELDRVFEIDTPADVLLKDDSITGGTALNIASDELPF